MFLCTDLLCACLEDVMTTPILLCCAPAAAAAAADNAAEDASDRSVLPLVCER